MGRIGAIWCSNNRCEKIVIKAITRTELNLATNKSFGNGDIYILYVNGEYQGESNLGKLMHDFNCTDANDMNFGLMADRTRYLKEKPKGGSEMCRIMEDMRNEFLKEAELCMLAAGKYSLEEIANISGLSLEEINQLKSEKKSLPS